MNTIKITCVGGAEMPTGSNFLIEIGGKKVLIDCGLIQGERYALPRNREPFPYDASSIDMLLVTHGHLDHVGRIPHLVRSGFSGAIVSTAPTRDIAELIMLDSLHVLQMESEQTGEPLLYGEKDVFEAMRLWKHTVIYEDTFAMETSAGTVSFTFYDAGHILGSASISIENSGKKILFTGDLGNSPSRLLPDTVVPEGVTHLFTESVYGDRNHEDRDIREKLLIDTVRNTIARNGTVVIPAFSIERTQEVLQVLNGHIEHGTLPKIPVYLDSPLGISVTKVYQKYRTYLSHAAQQEIQNDKDKDIFAFPSLTVTPSKEESKHINADSRPKVIIAGSGMSNGGRVLHHELRYLSDPHSTILVIGYQAVQTLGRRFVDGDKEVEIMGNKVKVRAEIVNIHGFSAHKDSDHLLEYVQSMQKSLTHAYVILGEPKSAQFLAQRIHSVLDIEVSVPHEGEVIEI